MAAFVVAFTGTSIDAEVISMEHANGQNEAADATLVARDYWCVASGAKIGDTQTIEPGDGLQKVVRLTNIPGCTSAEAPVVAEVEYQYSSAAVEGVDIPAGFQALPVPPGLRVLGVFVRAINTGTGANFYIYSKREIEHNLPAFVRSRATQFSLSDVRLVGDESSTTMDNLPFASVEIEGIVKGASPSKRSYFFTAFNTKSRTILIVASTPSSRRGQDLVLLSRLMARIKVAGASRP